MFPPSLHKNIRELDKQITLLESECENMETEERKRGTNAKIYFSKSKEPINSFKKGIFREHVERPFVTGPRIPEAKRNKPLSVIKICPKSSANSSKKISTIRETSTTTTNDEPKCNKKYIRICPICGRMHEQSDQGNKDKKIRGVTKCICGKELLNNYNQNLGVYDSDKPNESDNEKQVLHKGILHANPGGTIEVTVTQKSSKTPNNMNQIKPVSSFKIIEKNKLESCITKENSIGTLKRSPKGQKWSEILCQENVCSADKRNRSNRIKNTDVKSNYSLNSQFDNHLEREPESYASVGANQSNIPSMVEREIASEEYNNENDCPDAVVSFVPKKSSQKSPFKRKNLENVIDASPRTERSTEEKDIQCVSEEFEKSQELFDPIGIICTLINAIKGKFNEEETKKILNELDLSLEKLNEDRMNDGYQYSSQDSSYVKRLQKHFWNKKKLCEKLMKDNTKLSENSRITLCGNIEKWFSQKFLQLASVDILTKDRLLKSPDLVPEDVVTAVGRQNFGENLFQSVFTDLAVRDQLLLNLSSKEKEYLSIITNLKVSLEKTKAQAEDNIQILKELNVTKDKLLNETKVADALRKSHAKMQEEVQRCMLENDKLKTEIRLTELESQKFCVLLAGKDAEIKLYKDEVESFQRQITDQLAALRSNNAANEVQKAMEAIIQQSQAFSVTDLDSAFSEGQTEEKTTLSRSKQRDKVMHSSPTSTKSSLSNCSWNDISSIHEEASKVDLDQTLNEVLIGSTGKKENCIEEEMPSFTSCKSANDTLSQSFRSEENLGLAKQNLRRNINELLEDIKQIYSKRILSIPSEKVIFESSEMSATSEISASFLGKS